MNEPTDELIRVRRAPERGTRDQPTIDAILDAGFICHLGYLHDGRPVVVPTLYGRDGDALVLHGSSASRAMRAGAASLAVCVTVTLVDGLVLARSAFHHSAAYRSVVVHGEATAVTDGSEKLRALRVLTEHVAPGRWSQGIRLPNRRELRATEVLRLPLTHASAKVRDDAVRDDPEDLGIEVWAGAVPLGTTYGTPRPDRATDRATAPRWTAPAQTGVPLAPRPAGTGA